MKGKGTMKARFRIATLCTVLVALCSAIVVCNLVKDRVDEGLLGMWECPAAELMLEFRRDGNCNYRSPLGTYKSGPRYSARNGRLRLDTYRIRVKIDDKGFASITETVPVTYHYTYRLNKDSVVIERSGQSGTHPPGAGIVVDQSGSSQHAGGVGSEPFATPVELRRTQQR
jgi:hypothetical protein